MLRIRCAVCLVSAFVHDPFGLTFRPGYAAGFVHLDLRGYADLIGNVGQEGHPNWFFNHGLEKENIEEHQSIRIDFEIKTASYRSLQ